MYYSCEVRFRQEVIYMCFYYEYKFTHGSCDITNYTNKHYTMT